MILVDWLIILGLYILPVVLVYYKTIKANYRLYSLGSIFVLTILISFLDKRSLFEWGIRTDNLFSSFAPYLLFLLIGLVVILLNAFFYKHKPVRLWWEDKHLLYMFIPISIAQEVVYRGFLTPVLNDVFISPFSSIIFNALLFTFLHIVFYDFKYVLPLLFLGGLGFSGMYHYYPNLILISVVHCVFNFVAVRYGFFSTTSVRGGDHYVFRWFGRWSNETKRKLSFTVHLLFVLTISFFVLFFIKNRLIPANFVLVLVVIVGLLSLFIGRHQKFSWAELGFTKRILFGWRPYLIFTALTLLVISLYSWLKFNNFSLPLLKAIENVTDTTSFLLPQILISIFQAIIFRSFLVQQLKSIFSDSLVAILLASGIFVWSHFIYMDFGYYSLFLFLAGLGFSAVYYYRPNVLLSALSHVILNIVIVSMGIFSVI